ncbi:MAG TPA: pyruvate kinase [Clostridiales bacterium]|nr:pyruvate kinase [Clostridiales bacterium]
MKKTKIVCTLGPTSMDEKTVEKLVLSGMNVARLNFSHGSHEYHQGIIDTVKRVRQRLDLPISILLDTKGPEIRIGEIENNVAMLVKGAPFTLTTRNVVGDNSIASLSYANLPRLVRKGIKILIDDGNVVLEVEDSAETDINCRVINGGKISTNKGINVPNVHLDMPFMSEKDKRDILFGIENDMDFIAASFVRGKEDVIELRSFLDENGGSDIKIISKIESTEGIECFDEILEYSDGIMVARGDMGVEVNYERLPGLQKRFIRKCYQHGKIAITATQMLESMINNPIPTRAETTDVANAVFDGTSAVMLSAETAIGKYPVVAVKTMTKILLEAERDAREMGAFKYIDYEMDSEDTTNAVCHAARTLARDLNAKVIIALTKSGYTARKMSKFRPDQPIVGATPEIKTYHQLALSWGVYPVITRSHVEFDNLFGHAIDRARDLNMLSRGDRVVVVAGLPLDISGTTNLIKMEIVGK